MESSVVDLNKRYRHLKFLGSGLSTSSGGIMFIINESAGTPQNIQFKVIEKGRSGILSLQYGAVTSCVTSSFSHSFSFVPIQFRCSFPFSVIIYLLRAFSGLGLLRPCLRTPLRATGSIHLTCPSSRSFRTHHVYCFTAPAVHPSYHFIRSSVRYHM